MKSSNKILVAAVILLLIANVALVVFIMTGKTKHAEKSKKPDPAEVMYRELNMSEEQQKQHKLLKDEHFKSSKPLFDSVRAAKTAFFALIKDSTVTDSTLTAYSNRIYQWQSVIDKRTFAHFKRLRNMFTPEQQPKFDSFIQKMMQRNRKDTADKKPND